MTKVAMLCYVALEMMWDESEEGANLETRKKNSHVINEPTPLPTEKTTPHFIDNYFI